MIELFVYIHKNGKNLLLCSIGCKQNISKDRFIIAQALVVG